jgi:hypothetical protein
MPCTWQGWVVMLVYIGIVVAGSIVIQPTRNMKLYLVVVIVSSLLFCLVYWWKVKNRLGNGETRNRFFRTIGMFVNCPYSISFWGSTSSLSIRSSSADGGVISRAFEVSIENPVFSVILLREIPG